MTSRSAARIAAPSWGSADRAAPDASKPRLEPVRSRPRVRWGIRADAGADAAAGAALLAATAGLWIAFLLALW